MIHAERRLGGGLHAIFDLYRPFLHGFDCGLSVTLYGLDHLGDFLGGLGCAFCQFAHFVRYHGKTASLLAGAGGLDGRI
jgi:hypothetical protein